jgi:hypothetical protein
MAAFWSLLMKHVQNHRGDSRVHLNKQLDAILCNTLKSMYNFDGREIATIAISLVKVMKQVESFTQKAATGSLHRILHNLLVGINSEKKQFILDKVAESSVMILSEFDARCLSNLIYSFGLAEYITKVKDGRTILDVLALEAMSKLQHFNSQDLSNMLWSYAKVESSNSMLFKAAGDLIVGMNDLGEFWPQHLSNILWAYATAGESHPRMFRKFADHIVAMKDLQNFWPQHFSNILWSYAASGESHPKLFSKFADYIAGMKDLNRFDPQALSNIIWAYATAGESHPQLYKKFGDHIVAMKDLSGFIPQHFSNILWAYATAGESHPKLFSKLGDYIVAMRDLGDFKPQDFSNIIWSYATTGQINPKLYKKLADHIASLDNLNRFKPQHLSNIAWAYATAGKSHPRLYNRVSDHIVAMKDLSAFKPQELSNIVWSYATARESHSFLFQKLVNVAISRRNECNPQDIANLLWAYASVGIIDQHLFTSFATAVRSVLSQCDSQALTNIAWAYAVANVTNPLLFNTDFVAALARANDFVPENLSQLHQWQLWQDELKSGINLPQALCDKCRQAFISESYQSSSFQDDVISMLLCIGLRPKEEVLTPSGYRLDALVEVNGMKVGIEVDGPYHFINQKPTGSTLLKRRQVNNLDDICIVSVPYWEWNKLERERAKKQEYLRSKLDAKLLSVGVSSHHELSISNAGERHAISTKHSQLLQGRRQAPTSSELAALRSEWQTDLQQSRCGRGEVRYPNYDGGHASNPAALTDINYVNQKHLRPSDHSYDQARKRSRRV